MILKEGVKSQWTERDSNTREEGGERDNIKRKKEVFP